MRHETYGPLGDDRYADYVESIRISGERLLEFFASILELAELEGGRRVSKPPNRWIVDDLLVETIPPLFGAGATQRHLPGTGDAMRGPADGRSLLPATHAGQSRG